MIKTSSKMSKLGTRMPNKVVFLILCHKIKYIDSPELRGFKAFIQSIDF